ncbi:MAG TPA: hypothetical protein VGK78_16655 [Nocardioides sp.]
MTDAADVLPAWRRCTRADAPLLAESGTEPVAYVVWRHDPDHGDV